MLYLPFGNSEMFELFPKEFSKQKKDDLNVMFLDNGAFHKAKK